MNTSEPPLTLSNFNTESTVDSYLSVLSNVELPNVNNVYEEIISLKRKIYLLCCKSFVDVAMVSNYSIIQIEEIKRTLTNEIAKISFCKGTVTELKDDLESIIINKETIKNMLNCEEVPRRSGSYDRFQTFEDTQLPINVSNDEAIAHVQLQEQQIQQEQHVTEINTIEIQQPLRSSNCDKQIQERYSDNCFDVETNGRIDE